MKTAKVVTVEDALKVLQGAGVIIDPKRKFQYWTIGTKVSDKMVKAGKILDQQFDAVTDKPEWRTVWMHKDSCLCRGCTLFETVKVGAVKHKLLVDKEREKRNPKGKGKLKA